MPALQKPANAKPQALERFEGPGAEWEWQEVGSDGFMCGSAVERSMREAKAFTGNQNEGFSFKPTWRDTFAWRVVGRPGLRL